MPEVQDNVSVEPTKTVIVDNDRGSSLKQLCKEMKDD